LDLLEGDANFLANFGLTQAKPKARATQGGGETFVTCGEIAWRLSGHLVSVLLPGTIETRKEFLGEFLV